MSRFNSWRRLLAVLSAGFLCSTPLAVAQTPSPEFAKVDSFIKQHCLSCHGEKDPKAGLSLHKFTDEASVIKGRKVWENVVQMVEAGEMPPKDKPRPDASKFEEFLKSVEAIYERADRTNPPDPGAVTIRRLNRVEYANTMRDLVGVDFNPAEDFPADDVGHGFDNIGDVLTVSPVLMERYLAAAENVMNRAIMPNPPKPPNRYQSAQYTEPSSPKLPMEGRFRIVSTDMPDSAVHSGPVHTPYRVEPDGEYVFRANVYKQREGDMPVKVAVLACGKGITNGVSDDEAKQLFGAALPGLRPFVIVGTVDVTATDPKKQQQIKVNVPPMAGVERYALALFKPEDGSPAPKLFIEHLALEGPLDPRPASHRRLLAPANDASADQKIAAVLRPFMTKAFRRPVTDEEVARYSKPAQAMLAEGKSFELAMQLAMQPVLCSPKFLFRVELDHRPDSDAAHPIGEFELASRLSYFLWSSMPDDELFALAAKGELSKNLEPQVRRMLKDPKSTALVTNFATQWLQIRRIQLFQADQKLFPQFNDRLRASMLKETELFVGAIVQEDRSILELLDADFTFLNEPLARLYGIQDTAGNRWSQKTKLPGGQPFRGDQFHRVALQDKDRGGLLTQASILAVTSNPTRTSPVKRGKWLLEQILGAPPPPPPPNVPTLEQGDKTVSTGTLRQRMEKHRENPACANCHAKMDPLGFAFENYDAIGAFRTKDGELPVDASGVLPDGRTIQGPAELKAILKEKKNQFALCLTEKLMIYAIGRGLEYYDKPAVKQISANIATSDYKFSSLVAEIAKSTPFSQRRGKKSAANQ